MAEVADRTVTEATEVRLSDALKVQFARNQIGQKSSPIRSSATRSLPEPPCEAASPVLQPLPQPPPPLIMAALLRELPLSGGEAAKVAGWKSSCWETNS